MSTVIRTVPAILAALFAATATLTANAADRSWNSESTGGSESPYNIWDTSSAGWNGSIGNGNNLHLNLAAKTYFNSGSGIQIASDFDVDSGDYVFTGPLKFLALKAGAGSKTVSITKKNGDWTIQTYNFVLCNGNFSTVVFTNESGNVTCTGTGNDQFYIGYAESSKGELVNLDGEISFGGNLNFGLWTKNTSTLTVEGGTVTVNSGHSVDFRTGTCTINLNGGTLTTKQVKNNLARGTVTGTINFNGGTLKANAVASDGLIKNGVIVNVGANGGTIDCNGMDIAIDTQNWSDKSSGGLKFTGGNGNTISVPNQSQDIKYPGVTTITPGTRLAVYRLNAAKNLIKNGIVVDGIPEVGQVIFTCTRGDGYTLEGVNLDNVKCPLAPNTKFELDASNTNIVVTSVGQTINYWTGAIDNDLGKAGNWSNNTVPNGDNACIFSTNTVTLTKVSDFTPTAITFLEGSAAVTINGDDFNNIVAVTNLSSASHTINAKVYFAGDIQVKQAAMGDAANLSKAHVTFAGGAYAADGCSLESGNFTPIYSRCVFGKYYLANTSSSRWTAQYQGSSMRVCVADGSYLYVPYAGKVQELYVGTGAKVEIGDMVTTSRPSYEVKGEMVVTNELNATIGGNTYLDYDNGSGTYKFEKVVLGSSQTGSWVYFHLGDESGSGTTKNVWIGAGGINIADNAHYKTMYAFGNLNNDVLYLRPWHSDYTIGTRSSNYTVIKINKVTHFGTTDENGEARTVTANGKLEGSGSIYIEGTGRFVCNNTDNSAIGAVTVKDTATLVLNKKLTLGAMTIKDGATLEIPSGATTGTSAVTLESGSRLWLNTTTFSNTLNLPTEGTATIRIDGRRLRSGDHVIASNVAAGATANVALDPGSTVLDGRKGELRVDGTNLVLTINPTGMVIIVR